MVEDLINLIDIRSALMLETKSKRSKQQQQCDQSCRVLGRAEPFQVDPILIQGHQRSPFQTRGIWVHHNLDSSNEPLNENTARNIHSMVLLQVLQRLLCCTSRT